MSPSHTTRMHLLPQQLTMRTPQHPNWFTPPSVRSAHRPCAWMSWQCQITVILLNAYSQFLPLWCHRITANSSWTGTRSSFRQRMNNVQWTNLKPWFQFCAFLSRFLLHLQILLPPTSQCKSAPRLWNQSQLLDSLKSLKTMKLFIKFCAHVHLSTEKVPTFRLMFKWVCGLKNS